MSPQCHLDAGREPKVGGGAMNPYISSELARLRERELVARARGRSLDQTVFFSRRRGEIG